MQRIKILPAVLGGVAVLGVVFLLFSVVQQIQGNGKGRDSGPTSDKSVDVFRMDGVSYTAQEGDNISFRLKADRIEVTKRKFGLVYLNPLKEAVLSNLGLEVYQHDGDQTLHNILSAEMVAQLLPAETLQAFGVVTRVRILGLTVKVIRDGQTVSSITAQHATIDPKTRVTELTGNVLVAAADGRSIMSRSSTWDQRAGLFSIDGPYFFRNGGKVVHGNGARFDAELRGVRS